MPPIARTFLILVPALIFAGADKPYVRGVAESTMRQLESIAQKSPNLEEFGKDTLEQGATLLDMGPEAVPVLYRWMRNKQKDWKVRYWAADMLAYVGDAKTADLLMKTVRDSREYRLIKYRALESITVLWKKHRANTRKLQTELETALQKTADPKMKKKIQEAILEIDI